jgi:hypothetical protein
MLKLHKDLPKAKTAAASLVAATIPAVLDMSGDFAMFSAP